MNHRIEISTKRLPIEVRKLVDKTVDTADRNGVTVVLLDRKYVDQGTTEGAGWFVHHPKPKLTVACKRDWEEWVPTLVHESCHMDQWIEKHTAWTSCYVNGQDAALLCDHWIDRKIELSEYKVDQVFEKLVDIELDCEKRTLRKINKYDIGIDPIAYAQQAGAYVCWYNLMPETRKWYPRGKEPYRYRAITKVMPEKLRKTELNFFKYGHDPIIYNAYKKVYPNLF